MSKVDAPHDPKVELEQAVENLARLRRVAAVQKADASLLEEKIAQFEESKALFMIQTDQVEVRSRISEAEGLVRNLAVDLYDKTDDKKPHPAVPIKIYTVLEYEEDVALRYIRENLPVALRADWSLFEKIAKVTGGRLSFVTEIKEPRATIARNLSKWEPVEPAEEKDDWREYRRCDVCGETWVDTGVLACPSCGSTETRPEG